MPWRERSAMDEKTSFILEWESGESTVSALCESFGISRTLAYRYIGRYLEEGPSGLAEQSRAPRRVWNRTADDLEQALVELRRSKPRRGALKLLEGLRERFPDRALPAASTIALILKRNGLVKKRRRVRRIREVHPIFEAKAANDIWSVDFKGEFRMGNMRYCYPLTVMDTYSRYVLAVVGMHRPTYEGVWGVFQALFKQYGLPKQIHSDNGEPFASAVSLSRLTRLAVRFMDLGIVPVYSDPGHPEHNGSHERMHEELKAEATKPPAYSLGRQQRKFDAFRQDYNEQRPHQALGQRKPAQLYRPSARKLPRRLKAWKYPQGMCVKYVCRNGAIRWGFGKWVVVSTTLMEKYIGLEEMAEGKWRVYYRDTLLGYLDEHTLRIQDDLGRIHRAKKKSVNDVLREL
jgi:transposase InsO family protein